MMQQQTGGEQRTLSSVVGGEGVLVSPAVELETGFTAGRGSASFIPPQALYQR